MICDISEGENGKILLRVGRVEDLKCGSNKNAGIIGEGVGIFSRKDGRIRPLASTTNLIKNISRLG